MPDNYHLIRERLGELGLSPRREEEICRELGEHLDDFAADLAVHGVERKDIGQDMAGAALDWPALRREIVLAETEGGSMNYRTKVLWLPAFCMSLLSCGLLALLQLAGFQPRIYWLGRGLFFPLYLPWLVVLPLVGAAGAFWSRRAGGRVAHQLLASLAPPVFWLAFFLLFGPVALFVNREVPVGLKLECMVVYVLVWVLLPSCALFLGVVPFLRKPRLQTQHE